jgi:hypothetical protein
LVGNGLAGLSWLPQRANGHLSFNSLTLIFDAAKEDVSATVGFESDDCDRDFRTVVERGAITLEPPTNKAWGVRAAYFKGPGELKFEIEGPSHK